MYTYKFKYSWNLIFWTTHFVSWAGLILPLFLMTPMVEGFTFGIFHNTISLLEFLIVFFTLGGFRIILNRYINWKDINFTVFFKIIVFTIIGGLIMQLEVYYLLRLITSSFFSSRTIPNMYFGGEELRFLDTILKTFSWVFGFFTIKMVINYNAFKLEGIALVSKVKQEEINIISSRIDADFMANGIELTKSLVFTDVKKARETLTQLSNVLRYNLTQEYFEHIAVQKEIVVIKDYLDLICGQFDNNLTYDIAISSDFFDVLITPMKFMNAIKKMISCHTIYVNITIDNNYLAQVKTVNEKGHESESVENLNLKKDLSLLFSKDENFELVIVDKELNVYFEILEVKPAKTNSYE